MVKYTINLRSFDELSSEERGSIFEKYGDTIPGNWLFYDNATRAMIKRVSGTGEPDPGIATPFQPEPKTQQKKEPNNIAASIKVINAAVSGKSEAIAELKSIADYFKVEIVEDYL